MNKLVIKTSLDNKEFDNQIKNLQSKISVLEKQQQQVNQKTSAYNEELVEVNGSISKLSSNMDKLAKSTDEIRNKMKNWDMSALSEEQYNQLQTYKDNVVQLDNMGLKYAELESRQVKINDAMTTQNIKAQKLTSQIETYNNKITETKEEYKKANAEAIKTPKNLDKGISSIKRFGLALFGIHSIWRLISRASSAYMAQDQELSDRMQSLWVGLGAFLAPALEYISTVLIQALGYLNVFVKALTGIDFIARANAKALDKQASSQKNLNKQTAGFDEANILTDNQKSSTSNAPMIDIPELNTGVVEKLKEVAKWIKENKDLLIKGAVAVGLFIGAFKLAGIISALGGSAGLLPLLVAIAGIWTIYLYVDGVTKIIKQLTELGDQIDRNKKLASDNNTQLDELSKTYWEVEKAGKATEETTGLYVGTLTDNLTTAGDLIQAGRDQITIWGEMSGANDKIREQMKIHGETIMKTADEYLKLKNAGKLTTEQEKDFEISLSATIKKLENSGVNADKLKEKYKLLTGEDYKEIVIEANLQDNVTSKAKSLWTKIKEGFQTAFGFGISGTRMATGGIVSQPKKYYSATGSIINNPGYGTVIGGEAGREGVLPLTDSQTMAQLGMEIGRYVTIYNTIDNYMDAKKINRILAESKSKTNFASNR